MFLKDQFYMQQALMLAKRGHLSVSPNPMVGCIIVKKGKIIGEGWHKFPGGDHAEIMALKQAGKESKNSTVYITLEPCCFFGKTLPCTNYLIQCMVKKVIIGSLDCNNLVSGKGITQLKLNGIKVKYGILEKEINNLNKIFRYYHKYNMPYVVVKWAMSLDGELKVISGDDKTITNQASHKIVHNLRNKLDAIMVGHNTIIQDNPNLLVRMSDSKIIKHPIRIVISNNSDLLPTNSNIFNTLQTSTILFTSKFSNYKTLEILKSKNVECIIMPLNNNNKIELKKILQILAKKNITSLLVEGGETLIKNFFSDKLVNEVHSFVAPNIIKGFDKKYFLNIKQQEMIEHDFYSIGEVK